MSTARGTHGQGLLYTGGELRRLAKAYCLMAKFSGAGHRVRCNEWLCVCVS